MIYLYVTRIMFCIAFVGFFAVAMGGKTEKEREKHLFASVVMAFLVFYSIFIGDSIK